jgi:hypothetical protein
VLQVFPEDVPWLIARLNAIETALREVPSSSGPPGSGDMTKAVYDPNNDGKVNSAVAADSVPWTGVTGKPSTFTPSTHSHVAADVTDFNTAADARAAALITAHEAASDPHPTYLTAAEGDAAYAAATHTHTAANITDFNEAVDDRVAALLVQGSGVTLAYNDVANTLTVSATGGADPWTYLKLSSDFNTTSATAVDVTGLSFTPAANTQYEIEAVLYTRTATATVGVRPGVAWPTAGVTDGVAAIQQTSAAATNVLQNGNSGAAVLAPVGGNPNTTQSWPAIIKAALNTGASPTGTFRLQLASETAGTTVTLRAGSYLKHRVI